MKVTAVKTIKQTIGVRPDEEEEHKQLREENDITRSIGFVNFNFVCLQASSPFTSMHDFRDKYKEKKAAKMWKQASSFFF